MLEGLVVLGPGHEWHSPSLNLGAGDEVTVEAYGQSPFYTGLFQKEDYFTKFRAGHPFWFLPFPKRTHRTITYEVKKSKTYRVVLRVGSSQPVASIFLTVTIQGPEPGKKAHAVTVPPPPKILEPYHGDYRGPFWARDAIEAVVLAGIFGLLFSLALLTNLLILSIHWTQIRQFDSFAISLFQADAEWGIFLAALYVAIKTIPEWIRQRGGPER